MIHPELAHLFDEYNRVLDSYEAGHISLEDATAMLEQLRTIDGQGWVWSIDPSSGSFTKAPPGGAPQPADDTEFAPSQIDPFANSVQNPLLQPPQRPGGASTPPWAGPGQAASPSGQYMPPSGGQDPYATPGGFASPPGSAPEPDFGPPPGSGTGRGRKRGSSGKSRSLSDFETNNYKDLVHKLTTGRGRTLLIVAAIVIVIIGVAATKSSKPSTTVPTVPSTITATTIPAPAPPPTAPSPAPAPTAPPAAVIPTIPQMNAIVSAISQGKINQARLVVVNPVNTKDLVTQVAFYTGMAQTGVSVVAGPATPSAAGATSKIQIVDQRHQLTLYTGTARWVSTAGTWKLGTWPALTAAP